MRFSGLIADALRPVRRLWLVTSLLALASAAVGAAMPLMSRLLFDYALAERSLRLLVWVGAVQITLMLLSLLINVSYQYLATRMAQQMKHALQAKVYERILRLPLLHVKARAAGDLMSVVRNDVERVTHVAQSTAVEFVKEGLVFAVSLALIFLHNPTLGAAALLGAPVLFASFFL